MTTCIQFTLHVCAEAVSVCECVCVCVICVPGIISVNLCVCAKQWTAARPHYCHSPHCLKERQSKAMRLLSIEEPRKDGDKRPKLNKCWKAAWRASFE